MKSFNKDIGNLGEELSIRYLKNNNYKILDKNFRCKGGEIDIIVIKNSIVSFVEVKSRFFTSFGNPVEAITYSKQLKIINSAKYYIFKHNLYSYNIRFDVIEIIFDLNSTNYTINHIDDAFRLG